MIKKISQIAVPTIILIAILSASINAQQGQNDEAQACPDSINEDVTELKIDFYTTLETQLESADLNSERIHDLFEDYHDSLDELSEIASRNITNPNGVVSSTISNLTCRNMLEVAENEIESIFIEMIRQVGTRKRNFLLLEKYDQINGQLQTLQETVNDIRSDINTFDDQLPCIIEECVQR